MSAVNETLIRDVVAEVLGRMNGNAITTTTRSSPVPPPAAPKSDSCGCSAKKASTAAPALRGKFGVFQDANEACAAAHESFLLLKQKGIEARRKIEEIVKTLADKNAETWGRQELDETKI